MSRSYDQKDLTFWYFVIWMQLLEEVYCVVNHVCFLCEFILCGLDLFDGEKLIFDEVSEEREDEMAVAERYDGFCKIIVVHDGRDKETWKERRTMSARVRRRTSDKYSPNKNRADREARGGDARGHVSRRVRCNLLLHAMTSITRNFPWFIKDLGVAIVGQVCSRRRS